jgi:hypothetical protein
VEDAKDAKDMGATWGKLLDFNVKLTLATGDPSLLGSTFGFGGEKSVGREPQGDGTRV